MLHMEQIHLPSLDFIAGILSIEGSFMWIRQNKSEIPVFQLKMQPTEKSLLELIRLKLGLKEKIYEYNHQKRSYVLLLVRKRSTIENVIIPVFEGRLLGNKMVQFEDWKNRYFEHKINFIYRQNERKNQLF